MDLTIRTQTTGFCSPAEAYVSHRLDLNELVMPNSHTTFCFEYAGPVQHGVRPGNILVVDRSLDPKAGELVVLTADKDFKLTLWDGSQSYWGRVSWVLKHQG